MESKVFDNLIWHAIDPNSFLFGAAKFSLWPDSTVNYDYIVTEALRFC